MNNMSLEDAIDILTKWVQVDRNMRDYPHEEDDYDRFCEEKNVAIDTVLRAIKIKDEYSKLLLIILCDFDGANSEKELKDLIKDAMDYLKMSLDNDDEFPAYLWEGKTFNILHEEVKDEN